MRLISQHRHSPPTSNMDIPIHTVYLVKLSMLPQIEWQLHQLKEDNFNGILFEQSNDHSNQNTISCNLVVWEQQVCHFALPLQLSFELFFPSSLILCLLKLSAKLTTESKPSISSVLATHNLMNNAQKQKKQQDRYYLISSKTYKNGLSVAEEVPVSLQVWAS